MARSITGGQGGANALSATKRF